MDNRLSPQLLAKYRRLIQLLESPARALDSVPVPVKMEINDIWKDLKASGQSDADIMAHVSPQRFNA